MKYTIIGSLHGSKLSALEDKLEDEPPDILICLGDFVQTKTIREFMKLERLYKTITVPGDEDAALLVEKMEINPATSRMVGRTNLQLHEEIKKDKVAKTYLERLVKRHTSGTEIFLDEKKFGGKYKTKIVHGAYDGDSVDRNLPPALGTHLETRTGYWKNFRQMEREEDRVMIRGHDPNPSYAYEDTKEGRVVIQGPGTYQLFEHRRHVINPGALASGMFAQIETQADVPVLSYHKIK
ncbi:MAG: metallophosphoesterase family protein [Candidatus Aenigmarchaeota archaeon]|nr:metallophosphoesterase family protein [Candidatus Aenigmarchaeota archaeon]